ncbi:MAG: hypothetical protein WC376_03165 [Candidatus Nanoarchaeia archaeon]|jgi:hypothetical protein
MKLPKINLKEIEREKKRNFKERLKMIDLYAEWVKKNTNKKWSSEQAKILKIE